MSRLEDGGRIVPQAARSRYELELASRHVFAYDWAVSNLISPGDRVLEIGAGEGYGSAILAKKASHVTAIDPDPAAVSHAVSRYGAQNLRFLVNSGQALPFGDGEFDKVISFQVIEHLSAPQTFAREAARVLKPGGALCLTTPNRVHRLEENQKPWYKFHVTEFSAGELRALLSAAFQSCELKFITAPPEHFEMEMRVARIATLAQRLDPLELRNSLPYWLKQAVFSLISRKKTDGPEPPMPRFGVSERDENGLDLLAVCRKGAAKAAG